MAARGMPSHCRCGSGLLPKLRVCLLGRKGILLSYWGMPDHVKDMAVKNPYLLVSKKYAK